MITVDSGPGAQASDATIAIDATVTTDIARRIRETAKNYLSAFESAARADDFTEDFEALAAEVERLGVTPLNNDASRLHHEAVRGASVLVKRADGSGGMLRTFTLEHTKGGAWLYPNAVPNEHARMVFLGDAGDLARLGVTEGEHILIDSIEVEVVMLGFEAIDGFPTGFATFAGVKTPSGPGYS